MIHFTSLSTRDVKLIMSRVGWASRQKTAPNLAAMRKRQPCFSNLIQICTRCSGTVGATSDNTWFNTWATPDGSGIRRIRTYQSIDAEPHALTHREGMVGSARYGLDLLATMPLRVSQELLQEVVA